MKHCYNNPMTKTNTLGQLRNFTIKHKPKSAAEVKSLILNFNENKTPFYAVSTGHNWGYGCDSTHIDNTECIDLSQMNKIVFFDEEAGVITLEPGVTYGQLSIFLKTSGNKWLTPVHGGGPDCSIIGNATERGYGLTPYTDHFGACLSLKAILPSGQDYASPFLSIGQNHISRFFRNGIGPYLDGIFTQSSFGIITEMTIKLAPSPEETELFFISFDDSHLEKSVEIIKRIKTAFGSSLGGVNIMNKERVLSMLTDYPTELIKERKKIPYSEVERLKKNHMLTDWTMVGAFYGDPYVTKAVRKSLKIHIKDLKGRKIFFNKKKLRFAKKILSLLNFSFLDGLRKSLSSTEELFTILSGVPKKTALNLAYWKNLQMKMPETPNPTEDDCGLIWYAPLVQTKPNNVRDYVNMLKTVSERNGFNPLITLTTVDELTFDSTVPIVFNKKDQEDFNRAHKYHDDLFKTGKENGFYPYRLGTNSMHNFRNDTSPNNLDLITKIKTAVDPDHLYAQGRYSKLTK